MSIRILCLHGGDQSGKILRSQLLQLEERLVHNHDVELDYIDSPIWDWEKNEMNNSFRSDLPACSQAKENNFFDDKECSQTAADKLSNDRFSEAFGKLRLTSQNQHQSMDSSSTDEDEAKFHNHEHSKWFNDYPTQTAPVDRQSKSLPQCYSETYQYTGMDASLLHILQIWQRELHSRPYHGILAFHQGTVLANILLLSQKLQNCEFVIYASGYMLNDPPPGRGCMGVPSEFFMDPPSPPPRSDVPSSPKTITTELSFASSPPSPSKKRNLDNLELSGTNCDRPIFMIGSPNIKSLHLIGKKSTRTEPERSLKLALRFYNAQVYEHCYANDYTFPNRPRDINVIGKFIIRCKNEILGRANNSIIKSTQAELALVTQEASNLITSTIASNSYKKSKSLMAVIAPNTVGMGAWSGPKFCDPMDGGGAPCPSEFLKRKKDRKREKKVNRNRIKRINMKRV